MAEAPAIHRNLAGAPESARALWLCPALLATAAVGEVVTLLLMTVFRYHGQEMPLQFLDLTKTANLVGLLFELPFILLFGTLIFVRRFHTLRIALLAAGFCCAGLVALMIAPAIQSADRTTSYTGYLIFLGLKALELGAFATIFRRPHRTLLRLALQSIATAVAIVCAVFVAVVSAVLISPIGSSITDQPRQAYDAGVILGAAVWSGDRPSPVLRERINKGYDLLKNGTVQFLVLTGGHAPNELPEAEVARRELLKQGADPTRIVLETHTSSTLQQILFIRDQLKKKQGWTTFVIISDQFHLKRALEICQFNDIDALGVSSESPLGPQNLALYHLRESGALILYWLFGA
ncbi:MAG TPA: YdcF family protein [Candidatus Kapabacteria bacterium]|nr:YdcF family protein [Candidatus Kapabacteria bacterium]